jgi:hypothetical protein
LDDGGVYGRRVLLGGVIFWSVGRHAWRCFGY